MKNFKGIVVLLGAIGFSAHAMERPSILDAARDGDIEVVKTLIQDGVDLEVQDIDERTPLIWAATNGHKDIVTLLIDAGSNIEHVQGQGESYTPLLAAVANGYLAVVQILVDAGVRVNYENSLGFTALTCAVDGNFFDIVTCLLKAGANPLSGYHINNPLCTAVNKGRVKCAELLCEARINRLSEKEKQKLLCFGFCFKMAKGSESILAWLPKDVAKLIAKSLQCEFRNDNLKNVCKEVKSFADSDVKKHLLKTYSSEEKKKE